MQFKEICSWKVHGEIKEVEFMGIFQKSRVVGESPLIGGHHGGTVTGPIAVIKVFGTLKEVELDSLIFEKKAQHPFQTKYLGTFVDAPPEEIPVKGPCQL